VLSDKIIVELMYVKIVRFTFFPFGYSLPARKGKELIMDLMQNVPACFINKIKIAIPIKKLIVIL
jgi:hypothetical protein